MRIQGTFRGSVVNLSVVGKSYLIKMHVYYH